MQPSAGIRQHSLKPYWDSPKVLSAVQLHVTAVSQRASHETGSQQNQGTHDHACHYCSKVGPSKCRRKSFEARSKVSLGITQSTSVGGVIFPNVADKLFKLIQTAAQSSATPTEYITMATVRVYYSQLPKQAKLNHHQSVIQQLESWVMIFNPQLLNAAQICCDMWLCTMFWATCGVRPIGSTHVSVVNAQGWGNWLCSHSYLNLSCAFKCGGLIHMVNDDFNVWCSR